MWRWVGHSDRLKWAKATDWEKDRDSFSLYSSLGLSSSYSPPSLTPLKRHHLWAAAPGHLSCFSSHNLSSHVSIYLSSIFPPLLSLFCMLPHSSPWLARSTSTSPPDTRLKWPMSLFWRGSLYINSQTLQLQITHSQPCISNSAKEMLAGGTWGQSWRLRRRNSVQSKKTVLDFLLLVKLFNSLWLLCNCVWARKAASS